MLPHELDILVTEYYQYVTAAVVARRRVCEIIPHHDSWLGLGLEPNKNSLSCGKYRETMADSTQTGATFRRTLSTSKRKNEQGWGGNAIAVKDAGHCL